MHLKRVSFGLESKVTSKGLKYLRLTRIGHDTARTIGLGQNETFFRKNGVSILNLSYFEQKMESSLFEHLKGQIAN